MTLTELNNLDKEKLKETLTRCCGATRWVEQIARLFPVDNVNTLIREAESIWYECEEADWKEAFAHHPKIGDVNAIKEKFASTSRWASGEQAGVHQTSTEVLEALAKGNHEYQRRF